MSVRSAPHALRLLAGGAAVVCAVSLSGCGGSTSASPDTEVLTATPDSAAEPTGATEIPITITHDGVTPDGTQVEIGVGEEVVLVIDAEDAGELHVHSSPEKEIEFPAGTSRVRLSFDQPGVVDVEDHHLDTLIVQFEVR